MRDLRPLLPVSFVTCLGACGDSGTAATTGETTVETDSSTTQGAGSSVDTAPDSSTTVGDPLASWYGTWYAVDPLFSINTPLDWGGGGDGLEFARFEVRAGGATLRIESCLWPGTFEYTMVEDQDGTILLEPLGGIHEYTPHGEIDRLYIAPGADCNSLVVRDVGPDKLESDFLSWPIQRGELCLEKCAEEQGDQGLISDCGTPVPWPCDG